MNFLEVPQIEKINFAQNVELAFSWLNTKIGQVVESAGLLSLQNEKSKLKLDTSL